MRKGKGPHYRAQDLVFGEDHVVTRRVTSGSWDRLPIRSTGNCEQCIQVVLVCDRVWVIEQGAYRGTRLTLIMVSTQVLIS